MATEIKRETVPEFAERLRDVIYCSRAKQPKLGRLVASESGFAVSFSARNPQGDVFNITVTKVKDAPLNPVDPVAEFHRSKGCCDGSDPGGCHRRKTLEAETALVNERRARAAQRALGPHEYDGTEPSYFGEHSPCPPAVHSKLRMGDRCGLCGHVA